MEFLVDVILIKIVLPILVLGGFAYFVSWRRGRRTDRESFSGDNRGSLFKLVNRKVGGLFSSSQR